MYVMYIYVSTNKGNLIYLDLRYGSADELYYHCISILVWQPQQYGLERRLKNEFSG